MADNSNDKSVGRRGVLKGAVAAGVGVAAWSTPSITSIGGAPVYAAVCTAPVVNYSVGNSNTSCSCGVPPNNKWVKFKPLVKVQCTGDNRPTSPYVVNITDGCCGSAIGNSGICPACCDGNGYVSISGLNQFCKVKVEVFSGGSCGTTPEFTGIGSLASPGSCGCSALPKIPCQGNGDIFTRVGLVCSAQSACLPASTS